MVEASKLITIKVESRSQTPSLRLRHYCVRTILTTFYHMHHHHYAATGDMVKSFINIIIWLCTCIRLFQSRVNVQCNQAREQKFLKSHSTQTSLVDNNNHFTKLKIYLIQKPYMCGPFFIYFSLILDKGGYISDVVRSHDSTFGI
jgi:hypothetical protein